MDLLRADRDVAAAAADLRRLGADVDWEAHRHVAGQRALREIESQSQSPLRDGLLAWVAWLTVERVAQPAAQRVASARKDARAVVRLERDVQLDFDAIVSGLLAAKTEGEARAHFAAIPEAAATLREPERTLRETRHEATRRLGIDDVAKRFLGVSSAEIDAAARQFLALTDDLARDAVARRAPWPLDLEARLARDAREGWPSRLGWRAVAGLFPGLSLRANVAGDPPRALGAASFARAATRVGEAFHRASLPASEPFVVREPPLDPRATRTALVFASALGEPAFHARVLGLAKGRARDQSRFLRVAFLLDARFCALRVALRRPGDHEELTARTLGAPLPASIEGAWPALRDRDLARFLAVLGVVDRCDAMREREGDDWFRNPRAFATLREGVRAPAEFGQDAAARLARRFEEVVA